MRFKHFTSFLAFLVLLPFILLFLIVFYLLKFLVWIYLVCKHALNFKGFFRGPEIIFTLGGTGARGILTCLFYTEMDESLNQSPETLLKALRERFNAVCKEGEPSKIFYKRGFSLGYWYWLKDDVGPIEKYVRYLNFETSGEVVTTEQLRKALDTASVQDLPDADTRSFEVLVGNKVIEDDGVQKVPIVIRMANSMTDSIGISRFLMEILCDADVERSGYHYTRFDDSDTENISIVTKCLRKTSCFFCCVYQSIKNALKLIYLTPYKLFEMIFVRQCDRNDLHPKVLSGTKNFHWLNEEDLNIPLLETMKKLKRKYPDTKFNDVVAAITAKTIQSYCKKKNLAAPLRMTLVSVDRVEPEQKKLSLRVKVAPTVVTVPVGPASLSAHLSKEEQFTAALDDIRQQTQTSNQDYELMVHRFLLFVPALLPSRLARKWFSPNRNTILVSNALGPDKLSLKFGGHKLQEAFYWAPTLGRTGICLNLFSYNDKLLLSLKSDTAAMKDEGDGGLFLQLMVTEIAELKEALHI